MIDRPLASGDRDRLARANRLLLASALMGSFLAGVAIRIFNVSLPSFAQALHTDLVGISWALISYQVATTSLALLFGRLADVYGRERLYAGGFVVMTVSAFLCGTSTTLAELVAYRTLQGIGAAMIQSTSRVLAMRAMPPGAEGRANGFMTTAFQAGFVIGPPLGGAMAEWVSWRGIFFALVPIGIVGCVLTISSLRALNSPHPAGGMTKFDGAGAALFVMVIVAFVALLDSRTASMLGATAPFAWIGLGALVVRFWRQQRSSPSPIMNMRLFQKRMFACSAAALFLASMTYAIHDLIMPFYLQDVLGLAPSRVGLIFIASPLIVIAMSPLAGILTDRVGPRLPGTLGVLAMTFAYLIATSLTPKTHWITPAVVIALTGLGLALFNTPNHAAIIASAPDSDRGMAAGMIQTMFGLAHLIGVSAGSLLFRALYEHHAAPTAGAPSALNNPDAFVAAARVLFWVCVALGVAATVSSVSRGRGTLGDHGERDHAPRSRLGSPQGEVRV